MPEVLHISSLLLLAKPSRMDALLREIPDVGCAEVAMSDPSGKIIVTLETESEAEIVDTLNRLSLLDGVASASLVYHHLDAGPNSPAPIRE